VKNVPKQSILIPMQSTQRYKTFLYKTFQDPKENL